jgi:hypothetical protein
MVSPGEKDSLLKKYWKISDRQIQTSVVLADERWFEKRRNDGVMGKYK